MTQPPLQRQSQGDADTVPYGLPDGHPGGHVASGIPVAPPSPVPAAAAAAAALDAAVDSAAFDSVPPTQRANPRELPAPWIAEKERLEAQRKRTDAETQLLRETLARQEAAMETMKKSMEEYKRKWEVSADPMKTPPARVAEMAPGEAVNEAETVSSLAAHLAWAHDAQPRWDDEHREERLKRKNGEAVKMSWMIAEAKKKEDEEREAENDRALEQGIQNSLSPSLGFEPIDTEFEEEILEAPAESDKRVDKSTAPSTAEERINLKRSGQPLTIKRGGKVRVTPELVRSIVEARTGRTSDDSGAAPSTGAAGPAASSAAQPPSAPATPASRQDLGL
ncbi:unnamed protein product [Prorocentrum cordatum]|uniref:Uncharacterized protein n=1 Tax=Prorocentrum cordatum TaxID=2364126 RepID=A0ABN9U9Z2_9DINO|nr:unnamed protein product [Polarella glacialis]